MEKLTPIGESYGSAMMACEYESNAYEARESMMSSLREEPPAREMMMSKAMDCEYASYQKKAIVSTVNKMKARKKK